VSLPVQLRGIRRVHPGAPPVFAGLDLDVEASDVVALLGPSGCGKSTLVRLVAGLEPPDGGEVRIGTAAVRGPASTAGLMFQEPRLLPWLDVAANVAFGLRDDERKRPDSRRRVGELLSAVGLDGSGGQLPRELSGGMAQRVALARALARSPEVLLLDEPFGAVDALTRAVLQSLLLALQSSTRATVLLVTHDVEEALRVARRTVVLGGRPARVVLDLRLPGAPPRPPDASGLAQIRLALLGALGQGERSGPAG
jgi:ABC-type nitrate/sulfonate/bicarbonate transport system ATPase subunit